MHSTPLHSRKPDRRPAKRPRAGGSSARLSQGHSVGEQLKAALGSQYSIAWLAEALACPKETAEALDGYWIVPNAHARSHALTVFSRLLHIDLPRLLEVFAQADAASARPSSFRPVARPVARPLAGSVARPATPAANNNERPQTLVIGSNDGTREVRRSQPTIEWRKVRHPARVAGQ